MTNLKDIYWTAGFLEGEGYFAFTKKNTSLRLTCDQVQREPLERLHNLFGGNLWHGLKAYGLAKRPRSRWYCSGGHAAGIMMTILPIMSPKRQEEITNALASWKLRPQKSPRHVWDKKVPKFSKTMRIDNVIKRDD